MCAIRLSDEKIKCVTKTMSWAIDMLSKVKATDDGG